MTAATATLRLWLVREHGQVVAVAAASCRGDAVHAVLAAVPGLVLGDLSCGLIGHALPNATAGVVASMRVVEPAPPTRRPNVRRPRTCAPQGSALAIAYARACAVAGLSEAVVRQSQEARATAVRHGLWAAMREHGLALSTIGRATGHHVSTISHAVNTPPDRPPDLQAVVAEAYAAASAALRSCDGASC